MYLYTQTNAHTMFKILHVICTCKASYMFQQVFVIFTETMTQRKLYIHEVKMS